jgi:sugar phosphate isomerase/epimerase
LCFEIAVSFDYDAGMKTEPMTRRGFLAITAMIPLALRAAPSSAIPMGLELYSVRDELKKDPVATVRAVAAMGYQGVEFYAPYFTWTETQTKDMKKLLDELGIRCYSTHNDSTYLNKENIQRAAGMNSILGSKYVVMASSKPKPGLDGWKEIADSLNFAADQLQSSGLKAGYHNHLVEFTPLDGTRPIEVLARNTKSSVMLQLDVGTCVEAGSDPVAWIRGNPDRIRSLHCKDWSPEPGKGFSVLFGEGAVDWKGVFAAASSVGGAQFYLMEQEGSRFPELDTAQKCLEVYRSSQKVA